MAFVSVSLKKWKYDVFLSFRSEDTRMIFTSHLYEALCQKGVYTFIDSEELKKGERISPALEKAIEDSRISVVVLSKTFAFSSSCLDEVVKILQAKDCKGQLVLPVFYDVDPSEVRYQKASFEEALIKHKDKFGGTDKIRRWRTALRDVASLSGWHLGIGRESTFIKRIVEEILSNLNRTPLNITKHTVGLESSLLDIESLLGTKSGKDVRAIGIYGIGGIGKTTLAKAVYNGIFNLFEASTFIANVRETSKQKFGLIQLQEALLSEILNYGNLKVGNVDRGINLIKERLCSKRVLIVLDDVDSMGQLESLVGEHSWFGPGSRVIITTRDEHLLIAHNVEAAYKVKELSNDHALELFSWYAFKKPYPPANYENLSFKVLNYAKGLPLALTVLGSYFCGRSMIEWTSGLKKLKNTPNKQISEVLKISFDGLEENEKAIFLDIACFFKGEEKEYVKKILEACELHPDIGIGVLVEKSLVAVDMNKLWMHDLIQEMAKEIVLSESSKDPCQRSRLWFYQDVLQVLMEQKEINNVEGIRLDIPEVQNIQLISGKAFARLKKLRILMVDEANISGDIPYLSDELRLIDWPRYPSSTLPPNFHPRRLVSLNLNHSRIKHLWKGTKIFRDLKLLSFSCCEFLRETPDFSSVPNIESLSLDHCKSLVKVHESVGSLEKLATLNLVFCSNLKTLPSRFKLKSLRTLLLTGCSNLRNFPEIVEKMESVEEVLLGGTAVEALPQSIEYLIGLKILLLDFCLKLEHLPSSIEKLQYLTNLSLTNCPRIRELPKLPRNTRFIWTNNCRSLQYLTGLEDLQGLYHTSFINCHKLIHKQVQDYITDRLFHKESDFEVILPGNKIPDWFEYHSTNGSISLEVASRFNGRPVDLFIGAVFEVHKASNRTAGTGVFSCVFDVTMNDYKQLAGGRNFDSLETSHVWLMKIKYGGSLCPLVYPFYHDARHWNRWVVSFGISSITESENKRSLEILWVSYFMQDDLSHWSHFAYEIMNDEQSTSP